MLLTSKCCICLLALNTKCSWGWTSLVLQVLGHKPNYWTNEYFELMMALNVKLRNSWSCYNSHKCLYRCHDNPSSSYDLSLWTKDVNLMLAPEEKSGDQQNHQDTSSVNHECLYKTSGQSIVYLLTYLSLDQSGGLTDGYCQPYSHTASLAKNRTIKKKFNDWSIQIMFCTLLIFVCTLYVE